MDPQVVSAMHVSADWPTRLGNSAIRSSGNIPQKVGQSYSGSYDTLRYALKTTFSWFLFPNEKTYDREYVRNQTLAYARKCTILITKEWRFLYCGCTFFDVQCLIGELLVYYPIEQSLIKRNDRLPLWVGVHLWNILKMSESQSLNLAAAQKKDSSAAGQIILPQLRLTLNQPEWDVRIELRHTMPITLLQS